MEQLTIYFSDPDPEAPLTGSRPGTLDPSSDNPAAIDPTLRDHLSGECDDISSPIPADPVELPLFLPPRLEFSPVRRPLAGYNATADSLPEVNFSVTLKEGEAEIVSLLFGGQGERVPESSKAPFLERLGEGVLKVVNAFSDRLLRERMFASPITICCALRLSDGSHIYPSPPTTLIPEEGPWMVELLRGSISGEAVAINARILRHPSRITWRLTDLRGLAADMMERGGYSRFPVALDFFIDRTGFSLPESSAGTLVSSFSYGRSSTAKLSGGKLTDAGYGKISPVTPGSPAWAFDDTTSTARLERLANPSPYRLAASIPLSRMPKVGEWVLLDCSAESLSGSNAATCFPDYFTLLPLTASTAHSSGLKRLLINPSYRLPPLEFLEGNAAVGEIISAAGDLPVGDSYLVELSLRSDIRRETLRMALPPEEGRRLEALVATGSLVNLFFPMEEVEHITFYRRSAGVWDTLSCELTSLSSGGAFACFPLSSPQWERVDLSYDPAADLTLPEEWALERPGRVLSSSGEIPFLYPGCGVTDYSAMPVIGCADFSGRRSGVTYPILLFGREGISLFGVEEVTSGGDKYSVWRLKEDLSLMRALDREGIISTGSGVAFVSESGVMLQTSVSRWERLSRRGISLPQNRTLLYHRAVNLLELRGLDASAPEEGRVSWWYDLEDKKELGLIRTGTEAEPGSGDADLPLYRAEHNLPRSGTQAGTRLLTMPFLVKGIPCGVRVILEGGIGNPPGKELFGSVSLEGSRDLWEWAAVGTAPGMELPELLPESLGWYRLRLSLPADLTYRPLGFILYYFPVS